MFHDYKKYINILLDYAENQGFKVDLNYFRTSEIYWVDLNIPSEINIEGRYNDELKVYVFLHELGHNELRKDWDSYNNILPNVANAEKVNESKFKRRIGYYVSCLEEEYKAWDKGLELAEKLGIIVRRGVWDSFRDRCLMGYIRYFGKK